MASLYNEGVLIRGDAFVAYDAALDTYTKASADAGNSASFSADVAALVSRGATSYDELADVFACEATVMQAAARGARSAESNATPRIFQAANIRFDGTARALSIYVEACGSIGNNQAFAESVASLVGPSSYDYDDLRMRFECEEGVFRKAAEIARRVAQGPHKTTGYCDKCTASGVKVRRLGMGLHVCLSCDLFG